jgi:hypothetical protein
MARPQRSSEARHTLDDFLRPRQREYLDEEYDVLGDARFPLWHLSQSRYPLDAETAAAVGGITTDFVLPWRLVELRIQEWAYPGFHQNALAYRAGLSECGLDVPGVPCLEALQGFRGTDKDRKLLRLWDWPEEFAEECQGLSQMIRDGLLLDHPELAGRYVVLPHLPLGSQWLGYVPLVGGCWIDLRTVELCEASASLQKKGFTRLPSLDRHSLAWHRFYAPHTRWQDPIEAPRERFLEALDDARKALVRMPGPRNDFGGRPFVRVEDYARWGRRRLPGEYLREEYRLVGIHVRRWNEWIDEHANDGVVDLYGTPLTRVESPSHLREGESLATHPTVTEAESALRRRNDAVRCLARLARSQLPTGSDLHLTRRQWLILDALAGHGPMGERRLAHYAKCNRRTLYKRGGLGELFQHGLVSHPRRSEYRITPKGRAALALAEK